MALDSHIQRQVLWSIASYLFPAVATLVFTPLIVQGLGAERYGIFLLAMTTIGVLAIVDLGLAAAATRELSMARLHTESTHTRQAFWTAMGLYGVISVVGGAGTFTAVPWLVRDVLALAPALRADGEVALRWAALGLFVNLLSAPWMSYLRAAEMNDSQARIGIAATVVGSLGTLWRGLQGDLSGALAAQVTASALSLGCSIVVVRQREPDRVAWAAPSWAVFREMARFAAWQFAAMASATVGQHLARLIIARQLGPADLTWYSVPQSVAQRVQKLIESAARMLFPRIARLSATGDTADLAATYRRAQKTIVLMSIVACVPLAACAEPFLAAWMGPQFADRAHVCLTVLAVGYAIGCLGIGYVAALSGLGQMRAVFATETAITAVGVIGLWPLLAWRGIDGVALAALLGWAGLVVPHIVLSRRLGSVAHDGLFRLIAGALACTVPLALAARAALLAMPHGSVALPILAMGMASGLGLLAALWIPGLFGVDGDLASQLRAALTGRLQKLAARIRRA